MDAAKSMKLPLWNGKESTFQVWWTRLVAYALVYGFHKALVGTEKNLLPDKEDDVVPDSDAGKKSDAARKRNAIAVANLTMAFTTDSTMSMVYKAQTDDWPSGKAHEIVEILMKKFKPADTMSRVEMRVALTKIKMKKDDDPEVLFEQLSAVQNRYNTKTEKIEEADLIAVVLASAPKEYQSVLTNIQMIKGDAALTHEDLNHVMNRHWRAMKKATEAEEEEKQSDIALAAFQGECFMCKKKGHKSHECPDKKKNQQNRNHYKNNNNNNNNSNSNNRNNNRNRFNGNCNNCGRKGHKFADCWKLEANASKRPANWNSNNNNSGTNNNKGNNEVANAAVESGAKT